MAAAPSQNPRSLFDQELCGLVLDTAPRLFAVVQVCGDGREDSDGWVVAWGFLDSNGPTRVFGIDGRTWMTLASPERAVRHFARRPGIAARLVWLAQPGVAVLDRGEAA
ncbi:hypothetical protein [Kitasatospora sp. NPDC087314]|uniref:hypothetical protein n=1 Tax=Kitasatospora sp. NPDC087314 TaxID=3364068 RepID=UPI003821F1C4